MKILVSVHVIWWNASAYYAVTAAQALAQRGHDVTVLAHCSTPAFQKARDLGLPIRSDLNLRLASPWAWLRVQNELARWLQGEKFDILNSHRPEDHFHLALAKKRGRLLAPVVRTVSDVRAPKRNPFNRWLHENWTDGFIYCAHCCQNRYQERFRLDPLPQRVIYSALDVVEFTRGDWKTHNRYLELSSPRLGMVARLSPNKGHRTLIEAAADIRQKVPSANFLVVGQEEEVLIKDLRAHAQSLGVEEAFTFTGRLDDPRPAIAACDLGVVASTESEVISRATQEFFAFGVPVVASRVNVLPEMVADGVQGALFQTGDAKDLARAILRLWSSPQRYQTCRHNAQEKARNQHDFPVLASQTEEFFHQLRSESRNSL